MAYVQIETENLMLSWVINKNPESGITMRSMRQGTVIGWFSSKDNLQRYNVFFKDGSDEISYKQEKDQQYEYINATKYNSPIFVLDAVDEFFRSASKNQNEHDKSGKISTFTIGMMQVRSPRFIEFFNNHFDDYEIGFENISGNSYKIRIATKNPIYELLNFVNVFAMMICLVNREYMDINDDRVLKYVDSLNIIDAPYYIRYLFKIKMIRGEKMFNKYKEQLENTKRYDINMKFSDTWVMRKNKIESTLDFNHHILDLGCNDGRYIPYFAKRIPSDKMYYAVDIDEEVLEKAKRRAKQRSVDNALFFTDLGDAVESLSGDPVDIVFTEVMEHMKEKVAKKLIKDLMKIENLNRLVVTTPCSDFNQFYFEDEEEMRHHDHDFEMSDEEFKDFMTKTLKASNVDHDIEWIGLGDTVNGIPVSQGAVITVLQKVEA